MKISSVKVKGIMKSLGADLLGLCIWRWCGEEIIGNCLP